MNDGCEPRVDTVPVETVVDNWSECGGVISAISVPDRKSIVFFYFDGSFFHIQHMKAPSPISASCMVMSLDQASQIAIEIDDDHKVYLYKRYNLKV